jgi:hypothetical protein
MSVVVLQCFSRGSKRWLYWAILYHAAVNFAAVIVLQRYGAVMAEVTIAVFAGVSLFIIWSLRPKQLSPELPDAVS